MYRYVVELCPLSMHSWLRLSIAHKAVGRRRSQRRCCSRCCRRLDIDQVYWSAAARGERARCDDTKRHSTGSYVTPHCPPRRGCSCCCRDAGDGGDKASSLADDAPLRRRMDSFHRQSPVLLRRRQTFDVELTQSKLNSSDARHATYVSCVRRRGRYTASQLR